MWLVYKDILQQQPLMQMASLLQQWYVKIINHGFLKYSTFPSHTFSRLQLTKYISFENLMHCFTLSEKQDSVFTKQTFYTFLSLYNFMFTIKQLAFLVSRIVKMVNVSNIFKQVLEIIKEKQSITNVQDKIFSLWKSCKLFPVHSGINDYMEMIVKYTCIEKWFL